MNLEREIDRINQIPVSELRYRDLMGLKSGWDKFSTMRLAELHEAVPPDVIAMVTNYLPDDQDLQARAHRWVLRGLEVERAIAKAHLDFVIGAKARQAWRERRHPK